MALNDIFIIMVVSPKIIKWGFYKSFEGPYHLGHLKFQLPNNPNEAHKRLAVVTATEGGAYDSVNMYDQCIISNGLIQWCEANYFLTSRMLHSVCEAGSKNAVLLALKPALDFSCAEFKKNKNGQWRFFANGVEVTTVVQQQDLFLGCNGKKGSWTESNKVKAKLWASCFANIWDDSLARSVQNTYTASRLTSFVLKESKNILWDGTDDEGYRGALRAAFISFSANNSVWANKHLLIAVKNLQSPKWSQAWCTGVLKELTFGPNVAIYPKRYNKIRPVLETQWIEVEFPKTFKQLKEWKETKPIDSEPESIPVEPIELPESAPSDIEIPIAEEPVLGEAKQPKLEQEENSNTLITTREPTIPTLPKNTETPEGILGWILFILHKIMSYFMKKPS